MLYIYINIIFTHYVCCFPWCPTHLFEAGLGQVNGIADSGDDAPRLCAVVAWGHKVLSSLVPWRFRVTRSLSWALNQPAHPGRDLRPRDARYPVLPFWLDGTELNGWDQQSQPLCRTWDFCERCGSLLLCFLVSSVPSCFLLALRNGYFTRHLSKWMWCHRVKQGPGEQSKPPNTGSVFQFEGFDCFWDARKDCLRTSSCCVSSLSLALSRPTELQKGCSSLN